MAACSQMSREARMRDRARFAISTAIWAPSVHNTQPWRFGAQSFSRERWGEISLGADPDRRLAVADPARPADADQLRRSPLHRTAGPALPRLRAGNPAHA